MSPFFMHNMLSTTGVRAATANFWQARPSQWRPNQRRAVTATAAFYSAKFRQGLGLGALAIGGGPGCDETGT